MERSKDGVLVSKDGVVGPVAVFDYYVDSVNGSDSNDGASADTAFATIGKLAETVSNDYSGLRIGLARGSYWRETLGALTDVGSNVVVSAYGVGKMPTIDGADVVPADSWSKTDGYTNIYDLTWARNPGTNQFIGLWEDSTRLRWVADVSTCDATPGTFYCAHVDAGATTQVYVHASDSGDPDANGKLYEITRRGHGLCCGNGSAGWAVRNIHTRRTMHAGGSLNLNAECLAESCIAEDGNSHNLFIGPNSIARDCIAWKCDWPDRINATMFIAHTGDGRGKTVKFERCIAVADPVVSIAAQAAGKDITGFYAHTAGASQKWDAIEYIDCAATGTIMGLSAADAEELVILRARIENCRQGLGLSVALATITDSYVREGGDMPLINAVVKYSGSVDIKGLRVYAGSSSNSGTVYTNAAGPATVRQSVIFRPSASSGYLFLFNGNHASTDITSEQNIFVGNSESNGFRAVGDGSSDHNVYWPSNMKFQVGSNTYNNFADYTAANPTLDANSIAADPLLNDPENGDFGIDPSSPAIALGAGLERPNIQYTAIPSDEEIEAM